MKTAVYIEDGLTQLVLTPETDFEKSVSEKIVEGNVTIKRGGFYRCVGGWVRENDPSSIMIVVENKQCSQ